jgi:hypothetical protein
LLLWLNDAKTYYQPVAPTTFSAGFSVSQDKMTQENGTVHTEKVKVGKYAVTDQNTYNVWHNTDQTLGPTGKYLVDPNGKPAYFVDPAINGAIKKDEEGREIERYDAPKATLMSYIIKGILSQQLPWGLVIMGGMIAVILEMTGIPSLAFAVGIYLPISTSSPIFVGGFVRWLVDLYLRRKLVAEDLTEEQIIAETDKSNGVLVASGYIAGAAVAGILFAIFAFLPALSAIQNSFGDWSKDNNPFWNGPNADWLGMIPFIILSVILYFVGREWLLAGKKRAQ